MLNLGGPLQEADIKPFLTNFFMDKNIIGAPHPIRWFIARYIAYTRSKGAAKDSYALLNYKSPLLENTADQAVALQAALDVKKLNAKVFVSMRYWHPMAAAVIKDIEAYGADRIILLPLYPQFSTTTTGSSVEDFKAAQDKKIPVTAIGCYPLLDGFIEASAARIRKALETAPAGTKVLFSAHGLPEKVIQSGDPYQMQCEKSAAAIAAAAGLQDGAWEICYQSRVGPLKWIGPSTEETLQKAAREKTPVVLYPHAFVSEHVETLVEIDIEYRHKAKEWGVPYFGKVETVGTHPLFINSLAKLVEHEMAGQGHPQICGAAHQRCFCRNSARKAA